MVEQRDKLVTSSRKSVEATGKEIEKEDLQPNELRVSEVVTVERRFNRREAKWRQDSPYASIEDIRKNEEELRDKFRKAAGEEKLVLRGTVGEIVDEPSWREKPSVLFDVADQRRALVLVFDLTNNDPDWPLYALIENTKARNEKRAIQAEIWFKMVLPKDRNHFVVTKALAEGLGIKEGKDLRIVRVAEILAPPQK